MYASKLHLVGHQSKNNHVDTVYVMANRLLGYSIYVTDMVYFYFVKVLNYGVYSVVLLF